MNTTRFRNPEAVVLGDWLERHLNDPQLRVFECTTHLVNEPGSGQPYRVVSGRPDYESGHIPGAVYLDLQQDFSVADSPYRFTLPSPEAAAAAFARHGVGDGTRVVLYSRKALTWATRFWWMLRWLGFDNAAILDGGYEGWVKDGRPVTTSIPTPETSTLTIAPRPELFVGKAEVMAAIGDAGTCTLNALGRDLHAGENPRYGRPGRIPGSVNVPAAEMVESDLPKLRPVETIAQAFTDVGAVPGKPVIAYCGGGIAASLDAFLLHQLGHDQVAIYDNSLSEWAPDPALPLETD